MFNEKELEYLKKIINEKIVFLKERWNDNDEEDLVVALAIMEKLERTIKDGI